MKLVYPEYQLELPLAENQIMVLSIENPRMYAAMVGDLWRQSQGEEGGFILSDRDKIIPISKELECVFNPFGLDCNDKKVVNKLYTELKEQAEENLSCESAKMNREILSYLDKVLLQVPYSLDYDVDFDLVSLLKIYGVKIENVQGTLLEKIVEYIKVLSRVCHIKIFVFVGLKQYLTMNELEQLYEFVFYEKISLIIIESVHSECISGEKCWLFDQDFCIIEL